VDGAVERWNGKDALLHLKRQARRPAARDESP
jgi:hypothetical protein